MRIFLSLFFIVSLQIGLIQAQSICKEFIATDFALEDIEMLKQNYGVNKTIPKEFELPILLALSFYPELIDTEIEFVVKKARIPLASRPIISSMIFSPNRNRAYRVIISNQTRKDLSALELKRVELNAQIGIIGHELGHTLSYIDKTRTHFLKLAFNYMDLDFRNKFEYKNDKRCIEHGLGYQLFAWSSTVRNRMNQEFWEGALRGHKAKKEGYMNPSTIIEEINQLAIYEVVELD